MDIPIALASPKPFVPSEAFDPSITQSNPAPKIPPRSCDITYPTKSFTFILPDTSIPSETAGLM